MPLRTEILADLPLWWRWAHKYDVRNIIVETKNERSKGSFEDVSQLSGYLNQLRVGRFGVLVARTGFTKNAIEHLSAMARQGESLVIPLDHEQLGELAKASKDGPKATMEYFRRRETLLLQSN